MNRKLAALIMLSLALLLASATACARTPGEGNPLRIPPLLEDLDPSPEAAEYVLQAAPGITEFFTGVPADTLGYNGSYLGPVLRLRQGEQVEIRVENGLDFPTTVHWHGLVVDGDQDGGPHQVIRQGDSWTPRFQVDQPAATLWYHPHMAGNTAWQVYYGLAGLIYIEDGVSDNLELPREYGVDDIPLVVQDRNFNREGNLLYSTSMMGVPAGQVLLVNGTASPHLEVVRERLRLRILNASNSQNFRFRMSDKSPLVQVASDGGFLEAPLSRSSLFLSPGERAEVVLDFSKARGRTLSLDSGNRKVLEFRVARELESSPAVPDRLATLGPVTPPEPGEDIPRRMFELRSMGVSGTINGRFFDMDRLDEEVRLGEKEIWTVRNLGGMMQAGGHPFHVHGTQFRVLSRSGKLPPPEELGYKDTVHVDVGEEVEILIRFTHEGVYMFHCHILEHEDAGMMGQFRVE
ncbi:multicopper oxidase family protein [Anaerotalea alkaliphila]|uniref:Multicopper oxidase domain-containing protein n=1 Tax=Anaerotalea alkaliphila TaxID=2662126 RepID=A0A7X5KMC1_9FIRM|nr:multicopper oxidase domain-containing protein [Anaerotalea alkaliphila]NDL67801.1 multicopper oxidase domain-containing protein [Anaerotalea alkaliphila]